MKNVFDYKEFLNEGRKPIMKYYAFDWDDNILMMPTVIHMEKLVGDQWVQQDVSTEEFAKVRKLDNWRPAPNAYHEFRDFGPRGQSAFLDDAKVAIQNSNFGPSWDTFIDCLMRGSIFAIITARGHEPDTIRSAVEYIIYNVMDEEQKDEMAANLTAYQDMFVQNFDIMREHSLSTLMSAYLDKCDFVGVSSPSFQEKYGGDAASPEQGKTIALDEFVNRISTYGKQVGAQVRLGFSDDDPMNVKKVEKHFGEISKLYDDIAFTVFDTSDPTVLGGVKKDI